MVSDFRKQKLLYIYYAFFDTTKSGIIEKNHFDAALAKIANKRGWKDGDIIYEITKEMLAKIWGGLREEADKDGDGQLSIDEWVTLWDQYAQNPAGASEWQQLYCRCIFQLEDAGNDGAIDCNEYVSLFDSFGFDKQESTEAFKIIAKGKDKVTLPEFEALWKEYFTTENPSDPGNFIFGKVK